MDAMRSSSSFLSIAGSLLRGRVPARASVSTIFPSVLNNLSGVQAIKLVSESTSEVFSGDKNKKYPLWPEYLNFKRILRALTGLENVSVSFRAKTILSIFIWFLRLGGVFMAFKASRTLSRQTLWRGEGASASEASASKAP